MWRKGATYRGYAHECLWHAEQAKKPKRRGKLIELAHFWVRVAQAVDADRATASPPPDGGHQVDSEYQHVPHRYGR
jgi:hypothetical protein